MNAFLTAFSDDGSFVYSVVRYLVFPLVLLLVGGVTAHILYPRWQDSFLRRKATTERRSMLGEDIVALMNAYVVSWRRLIESASFLAAQPDEPATPTQETERQQKQDQVQSFAEKRSEARDLLMSALSRFMLYCRKSDRDQIESFMTWDESQSKKRLNELPDIKEWREWEDDIRATISKVLQSSGR